MFVTYLRRELRHRRKQTVVVAIGLAVAIALVMVVSSVSAGVRDAQASVLESVYGVGTDVTVTQAQEPGGGGGPGRFEFDAEDGETGGEADGEGTRTLDQDRLDVARGSASFDAEALSTVEGVDHVTGAAATLTLENTSFSGEMPDFDAMREQQGAGGAQDDMQGGADGTQQPPTGGADGAGGSAFEVDSLTVTGVDPAADAVGPLTTVEVADGRSLEAADAGTSDDGSDAAKVAVLDATYAEQEELAVGDTVTVGGTDLEVVGTVTSTTGEGVATASDVYVPLTLAQTLADLAGQVTDLYVSVDSADNVDAVADGIAAALPDASVSTQSDLAGDVTGSLSTASSLVSTLGTWLSGVVLVAAFGLAILFTVSGVNRRTRELGTLKAIGWAKRRVVGQVAGESVVQGLIGGVAGIVLGGVAVLAINLAGITLSGSSGAGGFTFGGPGGGGQGGAGVQPADGAMPGGGGGGGGPFGQAADAASSAVDVVLHAPVSVWVVLAAVGLAVLGGLLAGVVGGGRAARLRPAEALRSLA
ncbi:ABC transporter permease [Isoptericola hypogeus]|uniref:ABC transporter permease n=1 Tax=Isoptericola hypogeus TaxID=300179 RepID=A0ABN2JMH8_9MICO